MKKILRIVGIVGVVLLLALAIIFSMKKPSIAEQVWDMDTTMGNVDAKNYFIIYSDILCPYCVAFENAMVENEEDLKKYIEENDILIEVRLSEFLYEYGQSRPMSSRYSTQATYCAKNEGKFWDYYNTAIHQVWTEFFEANGKSNYTEVSTLDKDYWIKIGKKVGLGEKFENCVKKDETLKEVISVTGKVAKLVNGMPYFKFNNFTTSGFDMSWGYSGVLQYFDSGLKSLK